MAKKNGYSKKSARKQTKKIKKVVFSLAEKKWYEKRYGSFNSNTVAVPFCVSTLNGIIIGATADANTRIGNKIHVSGIWLSLRIIPGTIANAGAMCRVIVFKDAEPEVSTTYAWTDIFSQAALAAPRNRSTLNRFTVVKDFIHTMNVTGVNQTGPVLYSGGLIANPKIWIPVKKDIYYRNSTATAGTTAYGGVNIDNVDLPNAAVATINMMKCDYKIMVASSDANCCQVDVNWQVLFSDI